jgi:hypothetical protein
MLLCRLDRRILQARYERAVARIVGSRNSDEINLSRTLNLRDIK